ncbi:MAG TPA: sulfatase-like hydrolase/transferase [Armatimonadaceae bacterium]|nr:sulfatase-like hydrolase/transferase [Armatimonadaceae bacterium]
MKTRLRHVAAVAAASLIPAAAAGGAARAQQPETAPAPAAARPNVLFIAVDDLKPLLGCYGDATVRTPAIDRLAARGVLFERAYCNQAVCAPSRNALMTGMRPQTLGIYDLATNFRRSAPESVTLAQSFLKAGYRTEAIGKIMHLGHGNREDAASWSVPHAHPGGLYASPATLADIRKRTQEARARGGGGGAAAEARGPATESADVPDSAYGDGKVADEAIKRLRGAAKEKPGQPFFLAVGFYKPHLPFCAPKKYWDLYDPAKFSLAQPQAAPVGAPDFAPQYGGELRNYHGIPKQGVLPAGMQRHLIHGYHAATSYMDAQVGRVLDELDASGLARNTIVVLWGDHGWHLGDHGMWCKHTNYEQAARIPLIVAGPGAKAGVRTRSLVETVDLYPTLCALAGVPSAATQTLEGVSFAPVLGDPAAKTRDSIIHVYPRGQGLLGRAVRTERHRLVEWKKPGAPADTAVFELYDYEADPLETRNLAAEQPDVLARLRAVLAKHPEAKPQISAAPRPAAAGRQNRAALFARRDANGDGKLTFEEFMTGQPDPEAAKGRFPSFDTNKDGVLSKEEFVTSGGKNPGAS